VAANSDVAIPASREESLPVALAGLIVAILALMVDTARGTLLLYGDAVAHLAIARRIFDSRNPGLAQLGGVWLPLQHVLMLPFIGNMHWWQSGLAGAWPSMVCYIASVVAMYRLARYVVAPRWAFIATAFFALNPNLMYLAPTAMTEPLFLALLLWATLLTVESLRAIDAAAEPGAAAQFPARITRVTKYLLGVGVVNLLMVFTRYDGWIVAAAIWCVLAMALVRRGLMRLVLPGFVAFTVLTAAGPLLWFWYNAHFEGDWLDFLRGPYSAKAIEQKTSPKNQPHYRGWHNPGWSLLFYTRTAQVDAAAWETGFAVLLAALAGAWFSLRRRSAELYATTVDLAQPLAGSRAALLLWVPLPFYVYSVSYGSVPIFIPQLWPHSYYNARYGMELLPALALYMVVALAAWQAWLLARPSKVEQLTAKLLPRIVLPLFLLNSVAMMYSTPLVLKEGIVNARTRVPFERSIATQLAEMPAGVPILMYNSAHVGALQTAGIPLRRTINEGDQVSFDAALAAPAAHAAYIVAIAGDPVDEAVKKHPEGLTETSVICTTGQPCARIFKSDIYNALPLPAGGSISNGGTQ
jgi:hypothetical protein